MRPVNLIPSDERRGAARSASAPTGIGAYVALGVLAVLVVFALVYQLSSNSVNDKKSQLADLDQELTTLKASSGGNSFAQAQDIAQQRFDNVYATVKQRFPWERRIRQLSHVLPADTVLKTLTATVEPGADSLEASGAEAGGSTGGEGDARASIPGPAFELEMCSRPSAFTFASTMTRMRNIDGVTKVKLAEAIDSDTSSDSSSGSGEECFGVSWKIVVGFEAPAAAAPTTPATPGGGATPVDKANAAAATSDQANASAGADGSSQAGGSP